MRPQCYFLDQTKAVVHPALAHTKVTRKDAKQPCRNNFWLMLILQCCESLSSLVRDWIYLFWIGPDVQKILVPAMNEVSRTWHLVSLVSGGSWRRQLDSLP